MLTKKDFMIKTLGESTVVSPLEFSTKRGDGIVNFVKDTTKIPLCITSPCEPNAEGLFFEKAGPRKKIFFKSAKVTAGIMTCGGLCPGLNNAIRSIVMQLHYKYAVTNIRGIFFGQHGLDPDTQYKPIEITPQTVVKIHEQGGSFLGTSRGKVDVGRMVDSLETYGINILFCLGGDGSQRGLHEIYEEVSRRKLKIACVGVPKTIDNDINYVERTFGLDTAVTIAKEAVRSAHCEAESAYNGVGLVKVMGRDSGFIAALTTLANSDVNFCLIPEIRFDLYGKGALLDELEKRLNRRHHAVIVVSEGAGQYLFDKTSQTYDASGNVRYNDVGLLLKNKIIEYCKEKNIPIDLKYIDPSYMIRSVPTNAFDSMFAQALGHFAVDAAMAGKTDIVIGYCHNLFTHVPIPLATAQRKVVDTEGDLWREVLSTTGQPVSLKAQK